MNELGMPLPPPASQPPPPVVKRPFPAVPFALWVVWLIVLGSIWSLALVITALSVTFEDAPLVWSSIGAFLIAAVISVLLIIFWVRGRSVPLLVLAFVVPAIPLVIAGWAIVTFTE